MWRPLRGDQEGVSVPGHSRPGPLDGHHVGAVCAPYMILHSKRSMTDEAKRVAAAQGRRMVSPVKPLKGAARIIPELKDTEGPETKKNRSAARDWRDKKMEDLL